MMKALKVTFVVLVMLIAMVAGTAYATLDVSDVKLGNDNQERDETVTKTFTIKNNFNSTITINGITTNADADFQLSFSNVPATLASGASASVTLEGFVPEDLDAVDADLKEVAQDIGTLTVAFNESGNAQTATSGITMQAENALEIKDVDADVTGESDSSKSLDDGDDLEVKPGDTISLDINIENLFKSSSDIDMDDIELSMDIESDGDFDINDDSDRFDLGAGDDDTINFEVVVEDDAEDEDHKVTLEVDVEDDNGARHGFVFEFTIKVERETHDLRISRFDMSPQRLTCNSVDDFVEVEVRVENQGRRDEKAAAIEVVASSLGFKEVFDELNIDRDESSTKRFLISVPEDLKGGKYKITTNAYYADDVRLDSEDLVLTVDDCSEPEPTTPVVVPDPTPQPPVTTTPPNVVTQPSVGSGTVSASPTGGSFSDSVGYVVLLIVLILVAGAAILGLGAYFLMRK